MKALRAFAEGVNQAPAHDETLIHVPGKAWDDQGLSLIVRGGSAARGAKLKPLLRIGHRGKSFASLTILAG